MITIELATLHNEHASTSHAEMFSGRMVTRRSVMLCQSEIAMNVQSASRAVRSDKPFLKTETNPINGNIAVTA